MRAVTGSAAGWVAALALGSVASAQALPADQAAMKAHVTFLASDALKGRGIGTPEYDVAAQYVAARMIAAGLEPAGDNGGFLQRVPLVSAEPDGEGTMTFRQGGVEVPLDFAVDYITPAQITDPDFQRDAEVVFVGYGVVDRAHGVDDYKGLDVRGKFVAVFHGASPHLNSEVRAHLGRAETKQATAAAHGAVGVITIESTARALPFKRIAERWVFSTVTWVDAAGRPHVAAPTAPDVATLSYAGAAKLFAGSRLDWASVREAERTGRPIATGPLKGRLAIRQRARITRFDSSNVVGRLRGGDPALSAEHVVLTSHLDGYGVLKGFSGDDIANGAVDDAVGVGAMLEAARLFQESGVRPRRSVLFVAVTAEEKGMVGSDYFARHPTAPATDLVANLNLDGGAILYPLEDVVAYGGARSTIGAALVRSAAGLGLKVTPDPTPEEGLFVRSDNYSFLRIGVPSLYLSTGPGGDGARMRADYRARHYHKPTDDLALPFDWKAGALYARLHYDLAQALANGPERPLWVKGDYFGLLYGGPGAR